MKEKKLYEEPMIDIWEFEVCNVISESNPGPIGGGDDEGGDP